MEQYAIGLDIGATNIKSLILDSKGNTSFFKTVPTLKKNEESVEAVFTEIKNLINIYKQVIGNNKLVGIGLALPGSVDTKSGKCVLCPNLGWENVNITQKLKYFTNVKVKLINDANAACLGEYFYGAGKGCNNVICLTLGTGIGSGFILDNRLLLGPSGAAGEAGHMVLCSDGPRCSCGRKGCFETLASATAIVQKAKEKIQAGRESILREWTKGNLEKLTAKIVFKAANKQDPLAREVVNEAQHYLIVGLANLVNLFNPEKIILGGGVMQSNNFWYNLGERVKELAFPPLDNNLEIVPSKLGNKAGAAGAAGLFFRKIKTIGGSNNEL